MQIPAKVQSSYLPQMLSFRRIAVASLSALGSNTDAIRINTNNGFERFMERQLPLYHTCGAD